jgi:DNA-binding NtrC family response regulator
MPLQVGLIIKRGSVNVERGVQMQALVIDDEEGVRRFVSDVLRDDGWDVREADSAESAFARLGEGRWSLVFCDVMLGGEDGYAVLKRFGLEQPQAQVVLMTGHGSAAGALDATAFGAHDYLLKPFSVNEVQLLARAIQMRIQKRDSAAKRKIETATRGYISDNALIGHNPLFVEAMKLVGRVAPTNLPVLITGESGTGKEIVARAIHRRSRRAEKSFVAVNCGAMPPELIESELFGHARGSFTGADRERQGLFEDADGGTILLDEIAETTLAFQVKLLRALQQGEIRRVGSNRTIYVDVRVIAATNRDMETEVREGRFRQDLLYRLNAVSLQMPALRDRRDDIPVFVNYFAARARAAGESGLSFAPETLRLLEDYQWPGNIRELENVIARAAALCEHAVRPEDLPERILTACSMAAAATEPQTFGDCAGADESWPKLSEMEGRYVARVLLHTQGNKQAAARLLDIDRKTIERMIKRHKIDLNVAGKPSPQPQFD